MVGGIRYWDGVVMIVALCLTVLSVWLCSVFSGMVGLSVLELDEGMRCVVLFHFVGLAWFGWVAWPGLVRNYLLGPS